MKIALTGANGFIGQHIVEAALAGGHDVLALDRSAAPAPWLRGDRRVSTRVVDLLAPDNLAEAIAGYDCVVHLAAVMRGDAQYSETLAMTHNLLLAMDSAGVRRLVGVSSISILDYARSAAMACIDEATAVNDHTDEMGPYARTKRDQERALVAWQNTSPDKTLVVLRPGIVYDMQHLSMAHAGFFLGARGLAAVHDGSVPFVHVENVASATLAATRVAQENAGRLITLNLVDDELPSQREYLRLLRARGHIGSWFVPLPWRLYAALTRTLGATVGALGKRDKVPDSWRTASVAARQKPFRFSNAEAKRLLAWQPTASFQTTFSLR
jgi:nucleoside-diphosphate-sugar epimerase